MGLRKIDGVSVDVRCITEGGLSDISGVKRNTIRNLVANGTLHPDVNEDGGEGHHRLYSILDGVAVAYGQAFRDAGCGYEWAQEAIRFVRNQTAESLEDAFERGLKLLFPLPNHLGGSYLMPLVQHGEHKHVSNRLNLEACYRRVLEEAEKLRELPTRNGRRGRERGMVCQQGRLFD